MRFLLTTLAILATASFLSACNTTEGAGEDLSAGGHAISNAARDASN